MALRSILLLMLGALMCCAGIAAAKMTPLESTVSGVRGAMLGRSVRRGCCHYDCLQD